MDDAVFKCPSPPSFPDGTLPRCVLPVCTGQKFDNLEGITHTCDGVGLGDDCGVERVHGVAETDPCVWNDSTSLKINGSPLTCSSVFSLASVPPASASHDCDGLTLQEEGTASCAERYEAESSATALTTQTCHLMVTPTPIRVCRSPVASRRPCCSVLTALSLGLKSSTRLTARTRLLARLASWGALLATSLFLATVLERSARIVKLSHTALLVKHLVQLALCLPTTLSSHASPSARVR